MPKKKRVIVPDTPRIQLNTIDQVRRRMVRIYALAERGELSPNVASKLIWILTQIRDTIEVGKIEPLLEQMENQINAQSNASGKFYRG